MTRVLEQNIQKAKLIQMLCRNIKCWSRQRKSGSAREIETKILAGADAYVNSLHARSLQAHQSRFTPPNADANFHKPLEINRLLFFR